ncbi:hypothetical protein [Bacillus sp. UMB0893]|uniref:hypothetical protein n=1 Tax=Bacillus sp. UMB0893 TaxID=2066053 RepID=UPI000C777F71|nr:hypothetical protein [Bacillus sp. UMB0893]PLR66201.1 hypothetical protein CYJ36_19035 [Bacillus sp. UMB0893]QNG58289.1 hypothetical protein H4O14_10400 [Bacillus sp. PAMC26568]
MNNFQMLSSLFRGGRRNKNLLGMFKRKRNNGTMLMLPLLGAAILGIIGSRNTQVRQQARNGYRKVQNTVGNMQNPLQNRNPLQSNNFNLANAEFSKELTPDITKTYNPKD